MKNGFLTGVFHGPSTHDRDLASNSEMDHILNTIMKYDTPIIFQEVSDIGEVRDGKARVKFIRLGESILLFLEYEEMEDIPYEIVETLKSMGNKLGYSNVIVVDSHNSLISKNYSLKKEDVSQILKTGIEALEEAKTSILQKFRAGVEKIEIPNISLREGLGSNGIYILMIETLTKKNGIIIIDSNNLHPSLKKKLEERLVGKYFDNLVITSTDTHEVTAQELIEGGYRILGGEEELNEYIIDAVSKASNKLLNNLKECSGHIYSMSVEAHVIGYNLLDKLAQMTLKSYEQMKKVFTLFTVPATLIVTLVLLIT
jgi:putative membrane protein